MSFITPLESRQISAGYTSTVVHHVDIQLKPGELTVLIGPNGCGKSTLLKALSQSLPSTKGSVLLNGKHIKDWTAKQLAQQLAVLPQHPVAPDELTVKELVSLGRFPYQGLFRQHNDDAICIDEAMSSAQVTMFADTPIAQLSGGQRQRCWIAMVMAQNTNVLLLDEPTTYLDLKIQVELMYLLQQLARRKQVAIGIVMHELNLAAAFADQLVLMKAGKIKAQGHPNEVFTERYLSEVFDLNAQVITDAQSNRPFCVPKTAQVATELALVGS